MSDKLLNTSEDASKKADVIENDDVLRCFKCQKTSGVKRFSEQILKKSREALSIRLANNLNTTQDGSDKTVELPISMNDPRIGYCSRPCYSNFVSINKKYSLPEDTSNSELIYLPSTSEDNVIEATSNPNSNNSQMVAEERILVNRSSCLICNNYYKRTKGRLEKPVRTVKYSMFNSIIDFATEQNDLEFMKSFQDKKEKNQELFYHSSCKSSYEYKAHEKPSSDWHKKRNHSEEAFKDLCNYVEDEILKKNRCVSLKLLEDLFVQYLFESYGAKNIDHQLFSAARVGERLLNHFGKKLKIINIPGHGKIAAQVGTAVTVQSKELKDFDIIQRAALILRREILSICPTKISPPITPEKIIDGECEIPELLKKFYTTLLCASNYRDRKSDKATLLVNSLSSDAIYNVTRGKVIPSKNVTLGCTLKSLTTSHKIIMILNRYGHIVSDDVIRNLETEAAYEIMKNDNFCPSGVIMGRSLRTVFAFDNFDRHVDSILGKIIMNDTNGIVIQTVTEPAYESNESWAQIVDEVAVDTIDDSRNTSTCEIGKKRKSYQGRMEDIPSYFKRPKMTEILLPLESNLWKDDNGNFKAYNLLDQLYLLSHVFGETAPMWVGFNSLNVPDTCEREKIIYLPPINEAPTDKKVVIETMRRTQSITNKCGDVYGQVTYDLGIGKIAFPLKSTEKDTFANIFIHVGIFHTEASFFKAIGSFIDSCGLTSVMASADLLKSGSIPTFLSGKHFSRCKRLHMTVAMSLEVLEFKLFLKEKHIEIDESLVNFFKNPSEALPNEVFENDELKNIFDNFELFHTSILNGDLGKTAQFYAIYIQLIKYFFFLERSVRMNDVNLLVYALSKVNPIFFTFNHHNYARWSLWYENCLRNIEETHPHLKEQLMLGVKRTSKNFSRVPIDLTLEQTINADASRRMTGIMHITNSESARRKWAITQGFRTSLISHTYSELGISNKQDVSNDLMPNRIKKNLLLKQNFLNALDNHINPFSNYLREDRLFNISTGRAARDDIAEFLTRIEITGQKKRDDMIAKCSDDVNAFQTYTISRVKILNFASDNEKKLMRSGNKTQEIKVQRDLFGRLLGIALETDIDMDKLMSYPLTPVPFSFCDSDGVIHSTDKSNLTKFLERGVQDHGAPDNIDVRIYDGFFILNSMVNVPQTFKEIAELLLKMITLNNNNNNNMVIYIVFDVYKTNSIKDCQHAKRANYSGEFSIKGPDQVRVADFKTLLKNICFKTEIVKFFIEYWARNEMADNIANKILYVSHNKLYRYEARNNEVFLQLLDDDCGVGHEEADTRIAYFISKLSDKQNVVVRCADTDIFIILLGNLTKFQEGMILWLEFGTGNHRRYINVSKVYENIGEKVAQALPGYHAFTGCDYNPCFYGKGKVKPLKILLSDEKYLNLFCDMGHPEKYAEILEAAQQYVCKMYATTKRKMHNIVKVDEARVFYFYDLYGMMKDVTSENFKKKLMNIDACTFPPCLKELEQQVRRSMLITSIWTNIEKPTPSTLDPLDYGWCMDKGVMTCNWYEGDELPEKVFDVIVDNPKEGLHDTADIPEDEEREEEAWESSSDEEE